MKNSLHREESHSSHGSSLFCSLRICKAFPHHLVAAAYTEDHSTFFQTFINRSLHAGGPHPFQICHCIFTSRKQNEVGLSQIPGSGNITNLHSLHRFQRRKIRIIGNLWKSDHCNFNSCLLCAFWARLASFPFQTFRYAIFLLDIYGKHRNSSHHRNLCPLLKHRNSRIKDGFISPELIDNEAFDPLPFLLLKKGHCPVKLCKYAAPVNVSGKKYRNIQHFGKTHIDNIIFFQIDLRRTPRPFYNKNIILFCQMAAGV